MRGEADVQTPGTVIAGKYRVERVLGSGGMGVVLAVRHTQLEELYALKLMLPAAAASAAARERFAREAKAAARLRSDHVARAIDFGFLEDDGPPYMVLELLTGQNLSERLASGGTVSATDVASWMLQACEALREAHEEGIIHRDLKPSNLFLARRSGDTTTLKVLDFGIAKTIAADAGALTKTATTMGSPFYMSPEQMRSAKNADARSDIWSLGVTMYELTTGRVPFTGETVTEVAIAVIECAVESPRLHRPDLPEAFERIVMRCLEKQPGRRYPSVDHLAQALAEFCGATWSLRPDAGTDTVIPLPSISGPTDPLALTDAASTDASAGAASGAASSQAATVAASPVLTMLGSSSAPSGSTTDGGAASTIDPVEKVSPAAAAAPRRRPRAWLIPLGAGAAAIAVVGLLFFRGGPDDQGPASVQAAATASAASEPNAESSPGPVVAAPVQAETAAQAGTADPDQASYGYEPPVSSAPPRAALTPTNRSGRSPYPTKDGKAPPKPAGGKPAGGKPAGETGLPSVDIGNATPNQPIMKKQRSYGSANDSKEQQQVQEPVAPQVQQSARAPAPAPK